MRMNERWTGDGRTIGSSFPFFFFSLFFLSHFPCQRWKACIGGCVSVKRVSAYVLISHESILTAQIGTWSGPCSIFILFFFINAGIGRAMPCVVVRYPLCFLKPNQFAFTWRKSWTDRTNPLGK
ncbi:uncharacterized protein GGS25DRAFT_280109 [Hypoxylon fragiforme]|uniref:uncharacterized protein n=1 Tax=Hypoxylon fragiforme TaxID=63214 RepID=UPI0020C6E928|nr:uncharacterized protein GGS25DRAFT_280109 [Hypoxylon fragiforme]KAI2608510.1 hypothetical protein GGS25DRAFT_280109 [Hypoxylon fragiforme]